MIFSRDYRRPFWRGFVHALLVVLYGIFISLIILSLDGLFQDEIGIAIQVAVWFFLIVLSVATCGYLIFYEPTKKLLHHHFKAASVMMGSTLGWLFVFLVIFLIGLVVTSTSPAWQSIIFYL